MSVKYLFPIRKGEISKFIVLSLMMVLIVFIYSVERTVKDTIVVHSMGAELISAIKFYGVLPSAVIFMLVYAKMSDIMNKTVIFHIFNVFFVSYFLIFSFFLYPNIDYLHFDFTNVIASVPCLKYPLLVIANWSYSLYYILAEMWASVMLLLLFWQTANQVLSIHEAKRIYPLIGLIAQIGMILSGTLTSMLTSSKYANNGWSESLNYINISVFFTAVFLSFLFWFLANYVVDKSLINVETAVKKKGAKFIDSLKRVFTSRYILLIATLLLCYGISINLVEGVWKAQARIVYSTPQSYAHFMGNLQLYTGIITSVIMLLGSYILNVVSWRFAALLTPIIISITGCIFFVFSIYQVEVKQMLPFLTLAPVTIAVLAGFVQNILSKGTKYSFFDATKEIAYIPLDESLKSKGKAAADIIGGRMGKGGGAFLQQLFLTIIPGSTLVTLSPLLFLVFVLVMVVWIISVNCLSKEFIKITESHRKG